MKITPNRFVRQYQVNNRIILRLTMVVQEQEEHDCMLVEYGPPTVSQEAFYALAGTPQYRMALQEFANEYQQFLAHHYPSRHGAINQ